MHCQGLFRFSFGFRCPPLFGNSLLPTSLFWSLRPIPSRGLSPRRPGIPRHWMTSGRSGPPIASLNHGLLIKHYLPRSVAPCRRRYRKQKREERRESHEKSECTKGNGENSTPLPTSKNYYNLTLPQYVSRLPQLSSGRNGSIAGQQNARKMTSKLLFTDNGISLPLKIIKVRFSYFKSTD